MAEADESDGSFLHYHPALAVVTNIEPDHLENYDGDFDKLKAAYVQFFSQVKEDGKAIVCGDDANIMELLPLTAASLADRASVTYGIDNECRILALKSGARRPEGNVHYLLAGQELGTVQLSVPGRHNVYNAMSTIITCMEAGLPFVLLPRRSVNYRSETSFPGDRRCK